MVVCSPERSCNRTLLPHSGQCVGYLGLTQQHMKPQHGITNRRNGTRSLKAMLIPTDPVLVAFFRNRPITAKSLGCLQKPSFVFVAAMQNGPGKLENIRPIGRRWPFYSHHRKDDRFSHLILLSNDALAGILEAQYVAFFFVKFFQLSLQRLPPLVDPPKPSIGTVAVAIIVTPLAAT